MLADELHIHIGAVVQDGERRASYNAVLGDSSFLLAELLGLLLKKDVREWDSETRWMDDSLITAVRLCGNKLTLEGVMIWGKIDTTAEWVDRFSFEIEPLFDRVATQRLRFSFCDENTSEVTYEEYKDGGVFQDSDENVSWKYVIESQHRPTRPA